MTQPDGTHPSLGVERPSGRSADALRPFAMTPHFQPSAEGSVLIQCGGTHVICSASIEDRVPPWLRNKGRGWVTAEYGMLPRATSERMIREAARGKQSGRTQEIQRLIGRSLRAGIDLEALGERAVTVDCDVIRADGGTRCASITGAWVALAIALDKLTAAKKLKRSPLLGQVAAVSVGLYRGMSVLDLDYPEDSEAETDMNVVMNEAGGFIEVQGTAEGLAFRRDELNTMLDLAHKGITELAALQLETLERARAEA